MSFTNISTRGGWRARRKKKWLVKINFRWGKKKILITFPGTASRNSLTFFPFSFFFFFTLTEYEPDELNPSLYSFHSNIDEKNKLLYSFSQQGIETVVDRVAKKNRIKDWIQSSVITEEDECEVCCNFDYMPRWYEEKKNIEWKFFFF